MQGRRDVPLSAAGRAEVAHWRLPAGDGAPPRWLSSPLSRAVETARALSGVPPDLAPALIEMDWGAWEGQRLADLRERHGDAFAANERRGLDFRPPGGETPREVMARLTRWLASLADDGPPIVAVTHNGVLRVLLAHATGWDMTGKPPVKLRSATLHRFALGREARLTLLASNLPLALSAPRSSPSPPAPSAVLR